jgi:hypothetical protein
MVDVKSHEIHGGGWERLLDAGRLNHAKFGAQANHDGRHAGVVVRKG